MAQQIFVALLSILLLLEYHIDFAGVQIMDEYDTGSMKVKKIKLNSADLDPSWDIAYNSTHLGVTTQGKCSKVSLTATALAIFTTKVDADICGDLSFTREVIPGNETNPLPSIAFNPDTACSMKADITASIVTTSMDVCTMVGPIIVTPVGPITPTYPPLAPGASPLSSWQLFQYIVKLTKALQQVAPLQLEASFASDTAFHLSAKYIPTDGTTNVSYANNSFPAAFADLPKPVKVMFDTLMEVVYEKVPILKIALSKATVTNGPMGGQVNLSALLPNTGASFEFDVLIPDLKCNADGSSCNFPLINGTTITHIDANLDGYPEVGYVVRSLASDIDRIVNAGLASALGDFCVPQGDRCTFTQSLPENPKYPVIVKGADTVDKWSLLTLLNKMIGSTGSFGNLRLSTKASSDTTWNLKVSADGGDMAASIFASFIPDGLMDVLTSFSNQSRLSVDLAFSDLHCTENGARCSFSSVEGVQMVNPYIFGLGDVDYVVTSLFPIVVPMAVKALNGVMHPYICNATVGRCQFDEPSRFIPPGEDVESPASGVTPLDQWRLITAMNNLLGALKNTLYGASIYMEVCSPSTLCVKASSAKALLGNATAAAQQRSIIRGIPSTSIALAEKGVTTALQFISELPQVAEVHIAAGTHNLKCEDDGYKCTFPHSNGLEILDAGLKGLGDMDGLVDIIWKSVTPKVNSAVVRGLSPLCDAQTQTCLISLPHQEPHKVPPVPLMVGLPIGLVLLTGLVVGLNIWRHRRSPVFSTRSGLPITVWRIVIEDGLFCLLLSLTLTCFICSNVTSAATVKVGEDLTMYSFSLINTVTDLWNAGLKPLAVFVMAFSGVYPYIKLASMMIFTVLWQRPDSTALKVIDCIGKFSFLDIFVMLILTTGLEIPGIADVHIWSSFYLFLVATVCSIIAGNYATHLWRRGTSVRVASSSSSSRKSTGSTEPMGNVEDDANYNNPINNPINNNNGHGEEGTSAEDAAAQSGGRIATATSSGCDCDCSMSAMTEAVRSYLRGVWWPVAIPTSIIILGLSLPVWIRPAIEYDVTGIAIIFIDGPRSYSLYDLSVQTSVACSFVSVVTVLLAPVLFAALFDQADFLGAWGAAEVLLLACVAGLLQIDQFVQFVLGDLPELYSVTARLQWTLIPLLFAAIVYWILMIASLVGLRGRIQRWRYSTRKGEDGAPTSSDI